MSREDFWQPLIAPEARKERSCQSFSASHIGPRADCPFHRPAFFRPGLYFEVSPPKLTWPQTSMFQVSNFEISPHISDFRRFFSYFLDYDDSEPREHWLCRQNFTFGRKKFKVWHLKYRCLRSRKLKFGRENFKVWHLKHRRSTSVENMFLAPAFTGRCNRR